MTLSSLMGGKVVRNIANTVQQGAMGMPADRHPAGETGWGLMVDSARGEAFNSQRFSANIDDASGFEGTLTCSPAGYPPGSASGLRRGFNNPAPSLPLTLTDIEEGKLHDAIVAATNVPAAAPPSPYSPICAAPGFRTLSSQGPETLSDYPHLHRTHHTSGYRDGMTFSRATTAQNSFNDGFEKGLACGSLAGIALGVIEVAFIGTSEVQAMRVLQAARQELSVDFIVHDTLKELQQDRSVEFSEPLIGCQRAEDELLATRNELAAHGDGESSENGKGITDSNGKRDPSAWNSSSSNLEFQQKIPPFSLSQQQVHYPSISLPQPSLPPQKKLDPSLPAPSSQLSPLPTTPPPPHQQQQDRTIFSPPQHILQMPVPTPRPAVQQRRTAARQKLPAKSYLSGKLLPQHQQRSEQEQEVQIYPLQLPLDQQPQATQQRQPMQSFSHYLQLHSLYPEKSQQQALLTKRTTLRIGSPGSVKTCGGYPVPVTDVNEALIRWSRLAKDLVEYKHAHSQGTRVGGSYIED